MTSLAEAYEGRVGDAVSRRRLYVGVGLFAAGALLTAVGVVVATTDLLSSLGLVADRMSALRLAGVLAGLGIASVLAGVFTVLPSSRRIKAAATIGASVSVLGVALFWYAYPTHWRGHGQELTLLVTVVYFFGTTTSVWCLFAGIATFKRRNDPGGTVSLKVTKGGETRVVEVPRSEVDSGGVSGGVGIFGSEVDVGVETQTGGSSQSGGNANSSASAGAGSGNAGNSGSAASQPTSKTDNDAGTANRTAQDRTTNPTRQATKGAATSAPASDGGLSDNEITSLKAEGEVLTPDESARDLADRYCGNCEHFRYVRAEDGMQPYCGFDGKPMDDMESCDEWEPNH